MQHTNYPSNVVVNAVESAHKELVGGLFDLIRSSIHNSSHYARLSSLQLPMDDTVSYCISRAVDLNGRLVDDVFPKILVEVESYTAASDALQHTKCLPHV